MYFVGLDIHKDFTFGVIKDEQGDELKKEKFGNTEAEFTEFLEGYPPIETKVVMESTSVWEFIYDMLEEMKYEVKLANPSRTRAIAEARIKTDAIDAATLADLLRANLVAESYAPSKEIRKLRDVVRQRKALVKGRTQVKNKIHAILIRQGIRQPYKTLCQKAINWLEENIDISDMLQSYFNILEEYNDELKFIDENITKMARKNKQACLLMTMPGIGEIRSMELIAEIADINRFPTAGKLCSYAGLIPSIRQSGNSLRHGRLIKQASRTLKNAFIEASWVAIRAKEANRLKIHYLKLSKKKGKQKAICAVARKMCCITHAMLRKNQEFIA